MGEDRSTVKLVAQAQAAFAGSVFSGDLFGKEHQFEIDGKRASVRLPKVRFAKGTINPTGEIARYVSAASYSTKKPTIRGSYFRSSVLLVEVELERRVRIPAKLLEHQRARDMDCATKAEKRHLDALAQEYQEIAIRAWRHWQQVASWATNDYRFALRNVETLDGREGLSLHYLAHRPSKTDVWSLPHKMTVNMPCRVNRSIWDHIGETLRTGRSCPIWLQYLKEASERLQDHDFSGCVLSCATASETIARNVFNQTVGSPSNPEAAKLVDKIAAQSIIGKWNALTGLPKSGAVHQLFDLRNSLIHSGNAEAVSATEAKKCLAAAKEFVEAADEWLFAQTGQTNPRLLCPVPEQ